MANFSFHLKRKISIFAGAMACILALPILSQAETILRDTPLQADRFVDAPVVVQLPRGTEVVVLKTEAGWTQIKVNVQTGWVRASVIDGAGAAKAKVAQMENGRLAGNNILATSGIRGVNLGKTVDANELEQEGKFDTALSLRLARLQRDPSNPHAQNSVCWHWLLQNQALNARPYCQKSIELDGSNYSALLNMGHTYLLVNDEAQAKKWYQETLLKLKSEAELNDGPVEDFKLFIKNGWQVQLATDYRQWFVQSWATQQASKASVSK
jgi:tetratricopeptide (TPR) repeat protein